MFGAERSIWPYQNRMKHLYILSAVGMLLTTSADAQSTKTPNGMPTPAAEFKGMHRNTDWVTNLRGGGPANDECAGAINMTVNGNCQMVTASLDGATQSLDPSTCSGFTSTTANDVWFRFTATAAVTTIEVMGGASDADPDTLGIDPIIEVFEGSCSDLAPLGCADANFPAGTGEIGQLATTVGNTYFYRVYYWAYGAAPTNYSFTTCVYSLAAPANDNCSGAIPVAIGSFCNPLYYSSIGATESLPGIACGGFTGNANDDIWFSFTATNANMTIGVIGAAGSGAENTIYDAVLEAFDACGGNSLGCADATLGAAAETLELSGLTVGTTYYFRTYHWFTPAAIPGDVGVCVVEGAGISIGINEQAAEREWALFPNPAKNTVTINYMGETTMGEIELFDVAGRRAMGQRGMLVSNGKHQLDVQALAPGAYTVRITANGNRTEQRLVIE